MPPLDLGPRATQNTQHGVKGLGAIQLVEDQMGWGEGFLSDKPTRMFVLMLITLVTAMGWGVGVKVQAFNRVTVRASAERFRQSIAKCCKNFLVQTAKCICQTLVEFQFARVVKGSDTWHTTKSEKGSNSSSKSPR